ncbi:MAG TPA: hypothetical protein PK043_12470, partial [Alicycliphilus sp.]|nr:hypothetical protein [Alicycliphilus sp.]
MSTPSENLDTPVEQAPALEQALARPYQHGFVTDIESVSLPPGLDEDTIRSISRIKREPQFLLDWRLAAFKRWQAMELPDWARLNIAPVDFQALSYYSAPKSMKDRPKSLDEVDPKLLETYEKLGVPLHERAALAGVAVDAVFDSVSVGTTFRKQINRRYPDLEIQHFHHAGNSSGVVDGAAAVLLTSKDYADKH